MILDLIFIVGCGRSGTTILGETLSRHSKIIYLNERRDLWFLAYPETDIWTINAANRSGKLALTAADVKTEKSNILRLIYLKMVAKSKRPLLVEKLPINNFRVSFINKIFPKARFIHIYRNALEVAQSIGKLSEQGAWYGHNNYKWKQLVQLANSDNNTRVLPGQCIDHYHKGLLEWRLSTEYAVNFLKNLPESKVLEISYAVLTSRPVETTEKIFSFLGINMERESLHFASNCIFRRSKNKTHTIPTETENYIGGDLLPLSISGKGLMRPHSSPLRSSQELIRE